MYADLWMTLMITRKTSISFSLYMFMKYISDECWSSLIDRPMMVEEGVTV